PTELATSESCRERSAAVTREAGWPVVAKVSAIDPKATATRETQAFAFFIVFDPQSSLNLERMQDPQCGRYSFTAILEDCQRILQVSDHVCCPSLDYARGTRRIPPVGPARNRLTTGRLTVPKAGTHVVIVMRRLLDPRRDHDQDAWREAFRSRDLP